MRLYTVLGICSRCCSYDRKCKCKGKGKDRLSHRGNEDESGQWSKQALFSSKSANQRRAIGYRGYLSEHLLTPAHTHICSHLLAPRPWPKMRPINSVKLREARWSKGPREAACLRLRRIKRQILCSVCVSVVLRDAYCDWDCDCVVPAVLAGMRHVLPTRENGRGKARNQGGCGCKRVWLANDYDPPLVQAARVSRPSASGSSGSDEPNGVGQSVSSSLSQHGSPHHDATSRESEDGRFTPSSFSSVVQNLKNPSMNHTKYSVGRDEPVKERLPSSPLLSSPPLAPLYSRASGWASMGFPCLLKSLPPTG
ncbi:hypothetical protein HYFRA_00001072 [Hymenoscyphus fraxineus]|uniref:Uncharacterized protein n=1 Tax=Hymenoscyphus fraxineus TaxID=746836 RepID=A0A9N9PSA2_9HELO|nr:hypothetical protein HYFRA_00001072 [Hymenoscyphus fraxineus]